MCFNILEDYNGCYNSDLFRKVLDFWFFFMTLILSTWSMVYIFSTDDR